MLLVAIVAVGFARPQGRGIGFEGVSIATLYAARVVVRPLMD